MSSRTLVVFLAVITLLLTLSIATGTAHSRHTGVILLGGTGDLARKYLWQSLFDSYTRHEVREDGDDYDAEEEGVLRKWKFSILAGGTSHASVATNRLKDIFDNNVKCTDHHGSASNCVGMKGTFFDSVSYFQLQEADDYRAMCQSLGRQFSQGDKEAVKEVVLYLAVPPSIFQAAVKHFKAQCMFHGHNVSFKIVLEKPQGIDLASAERLSAELLTMFEEEQLYRTDHYLAKSVVVNILPFRAANPHLEKLLSRDYVERVEIAMKETIGVQERYSFYNDMGVIRDVFQNHLTQLLTLVTLDLPVNTTTLPFAIEQAKVQVLKQVSRASQSTTVLGQYAAYTYEAAAEIPDTNSTALVPTFAAALLKIHSPRWLDVPFVLVSGKKLDERSSYIRIILKDNVICVSNCDDSSHLHTTKDTETSNSHQHHHQPHHQYHLPRSHKKQIIFHIGHGASKLPLISVSKSLGEPEFTSVLTEVFESDVFSQQNSYHGDHPENFFHATPVNNKDAYSTVIEDVLHGRRESFISTQQLLLAWQIWENVLAFSPNRPPRVYDAGDPSSLLNLAIRGNNLEFAAADARQDPKTIEAHVYRLHQAQTPARFLGHRLVSGTKEGVAVQLAREIEQAAETEIATKGVFHVAFSGGSTPVLLWQTLAQSFASEYWAHIHVWQVDERCVKAAADTHSNLFQLDRHLLRFVAVPWSHVHAMPVDVAGRLCDPELQGDRQYADSLRHHVVNLQLDFVVLGIGPDGHTASLFPHSPALSADSQTLVTVTDLGPSDTPNRMTVTLPLINR